MKTLIKNQNGFSLLQVIVAAGLMSMLSLALMNTMESAQKNVHHAEDKAELLNFVYRMNTNFLDETACNNTFGGLSVSKGETIDIDTIKSKNNSILAALDQVIPGRGYLIQDMYLNRTANDESMLTMVFEKQSKRSFGVMSLTRDFPLNINYDDVNMITSCYSDEKNTVDTAVKQACIDLGGQFDPDNGCSINIQEMDNRLVTVENELYTESLAVYKYSDGSLTLNKDEYKNSFKGPNGDEYWCKCHHRPCGSNAAAGCSCNIQCPVGFQKRDIRKATRCQNEWRDAGSCGNKICLIVSKCSEKPSEIGRILRTISSN
jgi:type II secretory pathway pseudopilin PulG